MTLKEQIESDIKTALLGGDRFKGEVLRGLKAAILNEEVAQKVREKGLTDEAVEQLIAREMKKRADSANQYSEAGRQELAETELQEAKILEVYLPVQASEDEIKQAIVDTIAKLGVSGIAGMGQVIGAVKQQFGTSADGSTVARLVKEQLQ